MWISRSLNSFILSAWLLPCFLQVVAKIGENARVLAPRCSAQSAVSGTPVFSGSVSDGSFSSAARSAGWCSRWGSGGDSRAQAAPRRAGSPEGEGGHETCCCLEGNQWKPFAIHHGDSAGKASFLATATYSYKSLCLDFCFLADKGST